MLGPVRDTLLPRLAVLGEMSDLAPSPLLYGQAEYVKAMQNPALQGRMLHNSECAKQMLHAPRFRRA